MKDIRLYIDKLHADTEDCLTISQTAPSDVKQRVFTALVETYRELADELERIAAAHAILDEVREKNLLGLCPSSGSLRLIRHFEKRGSGSSGVRV